MYEALNSIDLLGRNSTLWIQGQRYAGNWKNTTRSPTLWVPDYFSHAGSAFKPQSKVRQYFSDFPALDEENWKVFVYARYDAAAFLYAGLNNTFQVVYYERC